MQGTQVTLGTNRETCLGTSRDSWRLDGRHPPGCTHPLEKRVVVTLLVDVPVVHVVYLPQVLQLTYLRFP